MENPDNPKVLAVVPLPSAEERRSREIMLARVMLVAIDIVLGGEPLGLNTARDLFHEVRHAYAPSDTEYWIHGHSTERDFIYVTTQTLTREQFQKLSDEVGGRRSLLVCCSAFRVRDASQFPNLTIKKIPKMVLNRCEWGRDDYSLEIKSLPQAAEPDTPPSSPVNGRKKRNNGS